MPDPAFPFLGVHFTRMIGGGVHAGPNAVLALAREGYRWRDVDRRDVTEMVRDPGLRRLAAAHWRTGLGEMGRSLSRRALARRAASAGPRDHGERPRSSAVGCASPGARRADGHLLDDFAFVETATRRARRQRAVTRRHREPGHRRGDRPPRRRPQPLTRTSI